MEDRKMNEELPMKWWDFCKYIRFPLGIIVSIFNFINTLSAVKDIQLNSFGYIIISVNFALIILLCVTYYFFLERKKYGFEILITYYICELLYNSFINTLKDDYINGEDLGTIIITALFISAIVGVIWILPNYIYFKKRRHLFGKEEAYSNINEVTSENKDIINNKENTQLDDKKKIAIEEKEENIQQEKKKYCTKCGTQIEEEWVFCNYCGNKLK